MLIQQHTNLGHLQHRPARCSPPAAHLHTLVSPAHTYCQGVKFKNKEFSFFTRPFQVPARLASTFLTDISLTAEAQCFGMSAHWGLYRGCFARDWSEHWRNLLQTGQIFISTDQFEPDCEKLISNSKK